MPTTEEKKKKAQGRTPVDTRSATKKQDEMQHEDAELELEHGAAGGHGETSEWEHLAARVVHDVTEKISALMDLKLNALTAALEGFNSRLSDNTKRITETESRISAAEDNAATTENRLKKLEQTVKTLSQQAEAADNQSRRHSVCITGLKEKAEGNEPVRFFETWLPTLLNIEENGTINIDACRRAAAAGDNPGKIRPVIIKFKTIRDAQKIISAARAKGELNYEGNKLHIRPDISYQTRLARRGYNAVCDQLIKKGIRFKMLFPSRLTITFNGEDHSFKTPQEAQDFLKDLG